MRPLTGRGHGLPVDPGHCAVDRLTGGALDDTGRTQTQRWLPPPPSRARPLRALPATLDRPRPAAVSRESPGSVPAPRSPPPRLDCPHRGTRATLRHTPGPRSIIAGCVLDRRALHRAGRHEPAATRRQQGGDDRRRDNEIQLRLPPARPPPVLRWARYAACEPIASEPAPIASPPIRTANRRAHPHRPRELRQEAEREVPRAARLQHPARQPRPGNTADKRHHPLLDVGHHLLGRRPPNLASTTAASGPRSRSPSSSPPTRSTALASPRLVCASSSTAPRPSSPTRRPPTSASRSSPYSPRPPARCRPRWRSPRKPSGSRPGSA